MLYRYASLDYMKDIERKLSQVISGPLTPELGISLAASSNAAIRGQEPVHSDPQRWQRDTCSFFIEMRDLLRQDIAERSGGRYRSGRLDHFFTQVARSDAYEVYRIADEYQMCAHFVQKHIDPVDRILAEHRRQFAVDDHWFAYHYADFLSEQAHIPEFRVRTDIAVRADEVPPRAGVYISQDDPNAAPQFAWPDRDRGRLADSSTFSDIGLAALAAVGRDDLWFDQNKMYEFAVSARVKHPFGEHEAVQAATASSVVSLVAHTPRPSNWYFVEIVQNDYEDTSLKSFGNVIL
jgi:hypothetical protein